MSIGIEELKRVMNLVDLFNMGYVVERRERWIPEEMRIEAPLWEEVSSMLAVDPNRYEYRAGSEEVTRRMWIAARVGPMPPSMSKERNSMDSFHHSTQEVDAATGKRDPNGLLGFESLEAEYTVRVYKKREDAQTEVVQQSTQLYEPLGHEQGTAISLADALRQFPNGKTQP